MLWLVLQSVVYMAAVSTVAAVPPSDASSASAPLVRELTTLLESKGHDSIAAEDPTRPGHMAAALHIPQVQLLLIGGQCDAVDALRARLASAAYRDVYTDLHSCAAADSRVFIQDLGADGLYPKPPQEDAAFDVVYERLSVQTRFDGDFEKQKLSQQEYQRRFTTIDTEYARLVSLLIDALSGTRETTTTEPIGTVGTTGHRTNETPVDLAALLSHPDARALTGYAIRISNTPIQRIDSSRTLWVGPSADRTVMVTVATQQVPELRVGQLVDVQGTIKTTTLHDDAGGPPVYIEATSISVAKL